MAYNNDIVGLLTGTSSARLSPVAPTREQRMLERAGRYSQGMTQSIGQMFGADLRTPAQKLQSGLKDIDMTNPNDLAKLAKLQQATGDPVGAARTLAQRQAILNKEQADRRYEESQKTAEEIREEERERYETGLETAEKEREESRRRFETQEKRLSTSKNKLLKDDKERIFDAGEEADEAYGLVGRSLSLAERYAKEKPTGGFFGNAYEGFKKFVGGQDGISSLKTEFDGLVNERIIKNLPPGVASDKDIKLIQSGFPNSSWSAPEIEQWLRVVARISAVSSAKKDAFADYLNENRGNAAGFNQEWRKTLKSEGFVDALYKEYGLGAVTSASEDPRTQEFDQDFADSLKPREEDKSVAKTGAVGALLKSL